MSSQQRHQMLPPAALTDALEKARNGGGGSGNSNNSASVRDHDGPLSPHPPARAVQLSSRSGHRNPPASMKPSSAAASAAATTAAGGLLASPPPAPPPTPIGPVGGRPVIDDGDGINANVGSKDSNGSTLPPMLKLGAPASSAPSVSTSAASGMKLGSGGIGTTSCGNSGSSMMPPPPSDLLSRLDAFLPQLAKANQDLLKKMPTDGSKGMEVEESNGDNGDNGAGGVGGGTAAAASFCASASAAAAVASLQIDADMVQCGDSSDSDSSDSSDDSGSSSDSDEDDDEAEKGGPPTIEMSLALGPFGGNVGPDTDAAITSMVEDGDGIDGSAPSGGGCMDGECAANTDTQQGGIEEQQQQLTRQEQQQQQQQQPKKRKVLIEEISSSS